MIPFLKDQNLKPRKLGKRAKALIQNTIEKQKALIEQKKQNLRFEGFFK